MFGSDAEVQAELENRLARWGSCEPHEVLGVAADAGVEEIRTVFLRMTKELHPNRFARRGPELKKLANEVFLAFKDAHQRLSDIRAGKRRRRWTGTGPPGTMSQPIPVLRRQTPSTLRENVRPAVRRVTSPHPAPAPAPAPQPTPQPTRRPRPQRQTLQGNAVPPGAEAPGAGQRVGAGKNRPGRAHRMVKTDAVPVVPPPGPPPSQLQGRLRPPPAVSRSSSSSSGGSGGPGGSGVPPPPSRVHFRATAPGDPGASPATPAWTSEEVSQARVLLVQEKWQEAAAVLQKLVAAMPDNKQLAADFHYARAKAHRERGNLVDANIELRRALEADPDHEGSRREVAALRGSTSKRT